MKSRQTLIWKLVSVVGLAAAIAVAAIGLPQNANAQGAYTTHAGNANGSPQVYNGSMYAAPKPYQGGPDYEHGGYYAQFGPQNSSSGSSSGQNSTGRYSPGRQNGYNPPSRNCHDSPKETGYLGGCY